MTSSGALTGVKVLDLSRILAGPCATQLLGDYGADVIKLEKPGQGDDTRTWGPPFVKDGRGKDTTESAYYLCVNRNKRSLAVDISTPEGQNIVKGLLAHCDVLVENFKQGGLARYGLSYDEIKEEFPHLVYCSITGYGQTGPNAHKAGYDLMAQGYGGIMSLTGSEEPTKVGVAIADVMAGMYACTAILAALHHRNRSGEGQQIDLSLVDCQIAWLINQASNYLVSGKVPKRQGNQHPNIVPYQVFSARDGHIIVAVGNDAQFERLCAMLGVEDMAKDVRFATNAQRLEHRGILVSHLGELFAKRPKAWLLEEMERRSIPAGRINDLKEVFASDQVAAREMKISLPHALGTRVDLVGNPVKFSKTPVTYRRAPPMCGADSEEILSEFGLLPGKHSDAEE